MADSKKTNKKITKVEPIKLSRQAPYKVIQETRSAPLKSDHTRQSPKKTRPKQTEK